MVNFRYEKYFKTDFESQNNYIFGFLREDIKKAPYLFQGKRPVFNLFYPTDLIDLEAG